MTVDYRDPTHIMPTDSPVDQSKVSEANKTLAKWLRQKMYGVDVRESLARLAEQTSADVYDDRQTVLDYKNHANNEEQALRNLANKLSQEFNSILNSKTDNAEVVTRVSMYPVQSMRRLNRDWMQCSSISTRSTKQDR